MSDYSFVTLFDKRDVPTIQQMIRKINLSVVKAMQTGGEHDCSVSDHYLQVCEKRWDDHHNALLEVGNKKIDFWQVAKSDPKDLVTTNGARLMLDIIRQSSASRFTWVGKGTGTTPASIADTTLSSESGTRGSCVSTATGLTGWTEWAGMSMRFAALFGESHATIQITEAGVFTTSTVGTMLARDLYEPNSMTHTVDLSAFLICIIVEFISKNMLIL
jgi:hypothetical protein